MEYRPDRLPQSRYALRSHRVIADNSTVNTTTGASDPPASQDLDSSGLEPPKCYLLSVAAELRNEIYELAFTCNDSEVNLLTTKPPSSALLQTCRQINNEARQLLKEALHDYYDTNNFCLVLHRKRRSNPYRALQNIAKTHDLDRIKNLHVRLIIGGHHSLLNDMHGFGGMGSVIEATLHEKRQAWDAKLDRPMRRDDTGHRWLVPYRMPDGGFNYTALRPSSSQPSLFMFNLPTYFGAPYHSGNTLIRTKDQIEALMKLVVPSFEVEKQRKSQAKRTVVVLSDIAPPQRRLRLKGI